MSDLPLYPRHGAYDSLQLMKLFGSYWSSYFGDKTILNAIQQGRASLFEQATVDRDEAQKLVGLSTCPIYHKELWLPLYLSKSAAQDVDLYPLNYGPNKALYGTPSVAPYDKQFVYGDSLVSGSNTLYRLAPSNLQRMRLIVNRITDPTVVLVNGVDFSLDMTEGLLTIPFNVFNDSRISTRSTYNADGSTDTEALLWTYSSDLDEDYLWMHYGYIFGVQAKSQPSYLKFLKAVYDNHAGAPSSDTLLRMLSAAMDVPVAAGAETVERILTGRKRQIITDKNVYTVNALADLTVAVGDELVAGQSLTDTVQAIDLTYVSDGLRVRDQENRDWLNDVPEGQTRNPNISGLALDNKFMDGSYFASIFFPNREVPLQYMGITDNYPEVRFEVGGFPADIEQFWTDVHARGVAQGKVLANYLDLRAQPIDKPRAKDLPTMINPLLFVLRHLLKYNMLFIKIRRGLGGDFELPSDILNGLHWTLPPHIAYIIFTEIVVGIEEMTEPIWTETSVGHGPAGLAYDMYIHVSLDTEAPKVESVSGVLV